MNAAHARRLVRLTVERLAGIKHRAIDIQNRFSVSLPTARRDLRLLKQELGAVDQDDPPPPPTVESDGVDAEPGNAGDVHELGARVTP